MKCLKPLASKKFSRGQLSIPFHFIYVLVAGAVILLFFIGIVVKQKDASERELSVTLSQKIDAIFTGASLSEQTVNVIDVPEMEFSFACEDDTSTYTIGSKGSPQPITFQPFFAQSRFITSQLVTWTLEFHMPYKVINMLFIGSPTTNTYVVYDDHTTELKLDIMSSVPSQFDFKAVHIHDFPLVEVQADHIKIIFLNDASVGAPLLSTILPAAIGQLPDRNVHIVQLSPETATYYTKTGSRLEETDSVAILGSFDEKNPAFYAALFSDDGESYHCGMKKAFKRMGILADIYGERAKRITLAYPSIHECRYRYQAHQGVFAELQQTVDSCNDNSCLMRILLSADTIREKNKQLQENNCAALY